MPFYAAKGKGRNKVTVFEPLSCGLISYSRSNTERSFCLLRRNLWAGRQKTPSRSTDNKGEYRPNNGIKGVVQYFYMVFPQEKEKEDKQVGEYLC
jgi:hypothetical protein